MGIVLKDAHLIQFVEGDYPEETPDFIANSPWGLDEYNVFMDYIGRLQTDLQHDVESSRYVGSLGI